MFGRTIIAAGVTAALLAACSGSDDGIGGSDTSAAAPSAGGTVRVTSAAFTDGAEIPEQFTCTGAGESPPLEWTLRRRAPLLALVVDDPDAPGGTFVHWVVFDLPGSTTGIPQGGALPTGAKQATNSAGRLRWTPPCPPSGTHHYRFTVYALTGPTGADDGVAANDAIPAIEHLAADRGQLVGLVTHR
jgi:Raf kinase inhibitor-like YbhB/YbcL family protein